MTGNIFSGVDGGIPPGKVPKGAVATTSCRHWFVQFPLSVGPPHIIVGLEIPPLNLSARIGKGASLGLEIERQVATSDILSATNEMDSISGSKLVGSRIKLDPVSLEAHILVDDDCPLVASIETLLTGLSKDGF
jgi:hypothetical protein